MRHSVLLAMNCKDEPNVKEWVLYHATMGMERGDHLLIFDDFSETPVQEVLDSWKWFQEGRLLPTVTILRVKEPKFIYINRALAFARERDLEWLLYIDADEYLYLPERYGHHLHRFLDMVHAEYSRMDGIVFFWRYFGSSKRETNPSRGQCVSVYTHSSRQIALTLKTMVRVKTAICSLSPHHYAFHHKKPSLYVPMLGMTISNFPSLRSGRDKPLIDDLHAFFAVHPNECEFLAHYTHQSWACFCRRRLRPRDDTGKVRAFPYPLDTHLPGPDLFHNQYNDTPCDLVLHNYLRHLTNWLSSFKEHTIENTENTENIASTEEEKEETSSKELDLDTLETKN